MPCLLPLFCVVTLHLGLVCSCLDIRLVTANMLLELEELGSEGYLASQEVLSIKIVCVGVVAVLLNVQPDSSAGGASA